MPVTAKNKTAAERKRLALKNPHVVLVRNDLTNMWRICTAFLPRPNVERIEKYECSRQPLA